MPKSRSAAAKSGLDPSGNWQRLEFMKKLAELRLWVLTMGFLDGFELEWYVHSEHYDFLNSYEWALCYEHLIFLGSCFFGVWVVNLFFLVVFVSVLTNGGLSKSEGAIYAFYGEQ